MVRPAKFAAVLSVWILLEFLNTPASAAPQRSKVFLSFAADNSEYEQGDSALLSWATANAKFCQASGDWKGKLPAQGTYRTEPLDSPKTFTLKCQPASNRYQSEEDTLNVFVSTADSAPSPQSPTLSFNASAASVANGGSTTLSWSSTDADNCAASGGWSGAKGTGGNETVGPLTADTSFSLSCTGPGGTVNGSP